MKLKKIISITVIMLSLSVALQAMERHMPNYSEMIPNHSFKDFSPEQKNAITKLREDFVQKEIQINGNISRLRMESRNCMRRKEVDLEEYQRIERKSEKLKKEKIVLRREYNKQVLELVKGF